MAAVADPEELLHRVLVLERGQGFQDRAAVGGLAEFSRRLLERSPAGPPGLAVAVQLLQYYQTSDLDGRQAAALAASRALIEGQEESKIDGVTSLRATPSPVRSNTSHSGPQVAATGERTSRSVSKQDDSVLALDAPLDKLKGMRKATVEGLSRLGVVTIRDLLFFFPRTHYDYTDTSSISRMRLGKPITLVGTIEGVRTNRTRRGIAITTATVSDKTGVVAVRWFNQTYLVKQLPRGSRVAITGEPEVFNGSFVFVPKDYEVIESQDVSGATHAGRLVPIYSLTKGLYQRSLRQLARKVVENHADQLVDFLPAGLVDRLAVLPLDEAVRQYHFPSTEELRVRAEQRLALNELLLIQLGLLARKREWQQEEPHAALVVDIELLRKFGESLPFALTNAQRRVMAEILEDLQRSTPMSRLLQGDVGSGKTVVAAMALLTAVSSNKQAVLMAPTAILAQQHHRTLSNLLGPFGFAPQLLLGSTGKTARKGIYEGAASGELKVLIGTHALIQETVSFANLGLAISDEQHRFGVEQRTALRKKGLHPHTLAMTATPIPRTLAITIYGDLDVSTIDEAPPGRTPVITKRADMPMEAYGLVRREVAKGRQAFVICPVIEDSADSDMRSVLEEHKELQAITFPDLQVGLLHGRMKAGQKDKVLEAFRRGEFHILVATSVVEVGIDVPNATVMVIRDAHRFGLAQLHQFRGRVGRGGDQSYCVVLSNSDSEDARERLEALLATDNGFKLAEEDLRLRGPGEFWGTRQSGLPELRVAQLGDLQTIGLARRVATHILDLDADLVLPEHASLKAELAKFWLSSADLS